MYPILDTLVHTIPLVLCIPSICLAAFGIYVIQVKSTASMKNYKKILIAIALITLNFDLSLSVIIGPKPLPGAVGNQNNGIIGLLWPSGGRIQIFYVLLSFVAQFLMCVIGFSYREKSILCDQLPRWFKIYEIIQILTYILIFVGVTIAYFNSVVDERQAREYMSQTGIPYCEECSIFVIVDTSCLVTNGFLTLAAVAIFNIYIGGSIYRIRHFIDLKKNQLSPSTVKMQKMLLTALIWQYSLPFSLVGIPAIINVIILFLVSLVTHSQSTPLQEDLTAISLLMPAFFSIGHTFCTLYFTSPYRKYVAELLFRKRKVVVRDVTLRSFSISSTLDSSHFIRR